MQIELINFTYSFKELNISVGQIEEGMGYDFGAAPEPFSEMIRSALQQGDQLCDIKGCLSISDHFSSDRTNYFEAQGITFNVGRKIAKQLDYSQGCALFICTAGPEISRKSKALMAEGNLMEGYILDVIGSVMVETAMDLMQNSLERDMANRGLKITNRFSPGYCGWALFEQKQFFSLFPDGQCGIHLSDSCLMDPVKSVSGVIGFGEKVVKRNYECQLCELQSCIYRSIRQRKSKVSE